MSNKAQNSLKFSPHEWSIIIGHSSSRESRGSRIGWYASILAPIVIFCSYGLVKGEVTAVGLAFICLLGCVIWWIKMETQVLTVYSSIFDKIVTFLSNEETQSKSESSVSLEQSEPPSPSP